MNDSWTEGSVVHSVDMNGSEWSVIDEIQADEGVYGPLTQPGI